ncbi:hypothetical protein SAMN04487980_102490 [Streptomyces sp. cf124]|nr:hypothetical protein SAMN04487980_102490 [Streptomyces sp. cf124]
MTLGKDGAPDSDGFSRGFLGVSEGFRGLGFVPVDEASYADVANGAVVFGCVRMGVRVAVSRDPQPVGPEPDGQASDAAFAAMSERCWEPSRPMRATAV